MRICIKTGEVCITPSCSEGSCILMNCQQVKHSVGWECPRCGTIHAPWVSSCGCYPQGRTSTTLVYNE